MGQEDVVLLFTTIHELFLNPYWFGVCLRVAEGTTLMRKVLASTLFSTADFQHL